MGTDKTCQINVHNVLGWELDQDMLNAVLGRVALHVPQALIIEIYPQERVPEDAPAYKHPGWLEWIVNIRYRTGSRLTFGCIQRTKGAEFEFHS